MKSEQLLAYVLILGSLLLMCLSCDRPTSPANPNGPPDTRLANVPKDNDTVFALVTLNWSAGDYDGFIVKYQYRYFTYHFDAGRRSWFLFDSTRWIDTVGTGATIAFNSSDSLNRQQFLVRAVDNDGNIDPSPAEKILYTPRTTPPITRIVTPTRGAKVLASTQITDWWPGVFIAFNAVDQTAQGKVVAYAWSVDGGAWNWGSDTSVYVEPGRFSSPLNGVHTIRAISRNNTNLTDPVGDSLSVMIVVPQFDRNVLIIDETDEFNNPFITLGIPDSVTDRFYAEVFPGSDEWDFKTRGMPPRDILARYKLLVWQADDVPATRPHRISEPANIEVFTDYLRVGGKFVMTGWRILKSFAYYQSFPFNFQSGTFVYDYLHIRSVDETDIIGDCIGGVGKPGAFSNFRVDSTRLAFFPYDGKLSQVNLILSTAGFTDVLYSYVNRDDSPYVRYRGRAIALRYYGTVYDAAVLGFPMYFVQRDDARRMAQEILQSFGIQ